MLLKLFASLMIGINEYSWNLLRTFCVDIAGGSNVFESECIHTQLTNVVPYVQLPHVVTNGVHSLASLLGKPLNQRMNGYIHHLS
jgi:hypothetical protein